MGGIGGGGDADGGGGDADGGGGDADGGGGDADGGGGDADGGGGDADGGGEAAPKIQGRACLIARIFSGQPKDKAKVETGVQIA